MKCYGWRTLAALILGSAIPTSAVWGQSFGVELHNTLMPASGAMAGTSISRPQDVPSALNANPATVRQFEGTQFSFAGSWAESTFNMSQTAAIPLLNVDPFSSKSTAQGAGSAAIGVTQQLDGLGMPVTFGFGFVTAAGGAVDFRDVPQSNGTNSSSAIFEVPAVVGVSVTDRWSVGAGISLGIGIFDGPFVDIGGMTMDYALRGVVGTNYVLTEDTTVGAYYQTQQSFRFDDAVYFPLGPNPSYQDVQMDLPENVGFGLANTSFCEGRLLLAVDVLYKMWENAELFQSVYNNQWVFQFGTQYTTGRYRLRAGYAYAQNPLNPLPAGDLGGVFPPGGPAAVRYTQGLLAVPNNHRISAGFGIADVLPGLDLDFMAGGMFRDVEQLGPTTSVSVLSYWAGVGFTWRFGACGHAGHACSPADAATLN